MPRFPCTSGRRIVPIAILLLAFVLQASPAIASRCPPESAASCTLASQPHNSRAIAIVRVIGEQNLPGNDDDPDYQGGDLYMLVPAEMLKGTLPARFIVFSENNSGRFPLVVGQTYFLFLDRRKSELTWSVHMGWRGDSGLLAQRPGTLPRVREHLRTTVNTTNRPRP
jgi:hypothetical protein